MTIKVGDVLFVDTNVNTFLRRLAFYDETVAVAQRLRELILAHDLSGKRIHDANLAATMLEHGMSTLITQNPADFAPFSEIETLSAGDALAGLPFADGGG